MSEISLREYILCWSVLFQLIPCPAYANSQTLADAWTLAYQNNPSLEAQRASLRATDEKVAQALSNWRPSIDANGNAGKTYQYAPGLTPFGEGSYAGTAYQYGVQVTQPLFRGFRTQAETEAAEKQVLSERAKLEDAEQQLFLDTASAFLGVLRDEAALEIQRHNESVLQDMLKETQARSDAGELTGTDIRQAESRLARAHISRFQAETTLTQDKAAYLRLIGQEPDQLQPPDLAMTDFKNLEQVFEEAKDHNPNVIAAQFAVDQAKAQVKLNEGSLLPEVDLVGNSSRAYGQNVTVPGREDTSQALVQVTVPLYRSGADYSKTREAEETVSQRKMERDDTRNKAHELANNAWQSYMNAQQALDADKVEVEASGKALDGVREGSKTGTRTILDVLNAEQELLDAKLDLLKSQHDRDYGILQIKAATGQLTAQNLKLATGLYDPQMHYDDVRGQWVGFSRDDMYYKVKPATPTQNP
jgi:outer membrane protein